jgi:hypothetical protein
VTPCTLWHRHDPVNGWAFNHLGDGHETGRRPTPRHPAQVALWARGEWSKTHCWLTDDLPPKVVMYGPDDL